MTDTHAPPSSSWLDRPAALPALVAIGLALRVVAAIVVEQAARGRGRLCLFDDTDVYWQLAGALRTGRPYLVMQWDVPHYALRTPGYPLFLAACQWAFGAGNTLAARLVQAALGAAGVAMVDRLVARALPGWPGAGRRAALLAAVEPYTVGTSALLLSEAVFVPLLLLMLWGLAALWPADGATTPRRPLLIALATGLAGGAGVLVKPSWAPGAAMVVMAWPLLAMRGPGAVRAWGLAAMVAVGGAAIMAPWWLRNAAIYGRFVPTALWAGASLYDGLHPGATGASDMRFLDDPAIRSLAEPRQDAVLLARAVGFVRDRPAEALRLAAVKAGRFWSPWPNADALRSPVAAIGSAAVTLPLFALLIRGAWRLRRDARALVLLAGPLLGFAALHMAFVGSLRYRIAPSVPALGLAAAGWPGALSRLRDPHGPPRS